jgi:hypothetical protein
MAPDIRAMIRTHLAEESVDSYAEAALPAFEAVLKLHSPREAQRTFGDRRAVCESCDDGRSVPQWPCSTLQVIADMLGVSL